MISYLIKYDEFKRYLEHEFEMPDRVITMLSRFLEQNNGKFSKSTKENVLSALNEIEILEIETNFNQMFF